MSCNTDYKRKEALWKKQCSISHQLFCNCGDWTYHLKWPGSRGTNGSLSDTAISQDERKPSVGNTTTVSGGTTPGDVEEALDVAVAFELDDTK
nr:ORF2 [Torque teno neovison virus]